MQVTTETNFKCSSCGSVVYCEFCPCEMKTTLSQTQEKPFNERWQDFVKMKREMKVLNG